MAGTAPAAYTMLPIQGTPSVLRVCLCWGLMMLAACGEAEPSMDSPSRQRGRESSPSSTLEGSLSGLVELESASREGCLILSLQDASGARLYSRRYELIDPAWYPTSRGQALYFGLGEADRERQAPALPQAPFELEALYDPDGDPRTSTGAYGTRLVVQVPERNLVISIPGPLSERKRP